MRHAMLLSVLGLAGLAEAQIPLPSFVNTFTSTLTRGYWFQMPPAGPPGVIVGASVPNEAVQAFQVVEIIDLGLSPPPVWPATGTFPQLFFSNNTAAASLIPMGIPLVPGNYYGVLGACTSSIGSSTSYNSYAANGAFTSNILGNPVTLTRFGTQFGISATGGNNPVWTEPPFQVSRVELHIVPVSGSLATNTVLGVGCIKQNTSFFENFATSGAFDLDNTVMTMIPSGPGSYIVLQGGGALLPVGSIATPVVLALSDDSEVTRTFTTGTFPGATSFNICSNGFVSIGSNGVSTTPDVNTFLNAANTAWRSWHNFNPAIAGGGQVKYEESAAAIVVTWDGVWDAGGTSAANANTMQMQFYPSGQVTFAWGTMSHLGNGHLVGYSPGGSSLNPGNTDLSTLVANVLMLGATDIVPLALAPTTRPIIGTNWNLTTSQIPATGVLGVDIFGLADPGVLDLSFLGMPGCQLRSTLDLIDGPWLVAGTTHSYAFPIPNSV
ncbi:MAG TPA: hypothetical protein VFT55_16930, partial [Planctomycetota bacterium]|nr:hypothetical protein [Planctomycetota bacterium]